MSGDLFLFGSGRRRGCKVLLWDGTGLCIFMNRLERGRFADLWGGRGGAPVKLTSSEWALFIEGCALVGRQALSPTEITSKSLALVDRACSSSGRGGSRTRDRHRAAPADRASSEVAARAPDYPRS